MGVVLRSAWGKVNIAGISYYLNTHLAATKLTVACKFWVAAWRSGNVTELVLSAKLLYVELG